MTDVIVIGHGGYGTAMKNNLGMLVGELEGFYSEVSFNLELSALELAEMACDVARETILMFPAKE